MLSVARGWARRYERRYIQRWLSSGNATCPASGQALTLPAALTPNLALRKSIEAWAEKYAQWLLVRSGAAAMRPCCCGHRRQSPQGMLAVALRVRTPHDV